jgi:hypothetical protein
LKERKKSDDGRSRYIIPRRRVDVLWDVDASTYVVSGLDMRPDTS